jgi:hypothetical protein
VCVCLVMYVEFRTCVIDVFTFLVNDNSNFVVYNTVEW